MRNDLSCAALESVQGTSPLTQATARLVRLASDYRMQCYETSCVCQRAAWCTEVEGGCVRSMLEDISRIARQSSNRTPGYRLNPSETELSERNPGGVRTGIVSSTVRYEPEPTV